MISQLPGGLHFRSLLVPQECTLQVTSLALSTFHVWNAADQPSWDWTCRLKPPCFPIMCKHNRPNNTWHMQESVPSAWLKWPKPVLSKQTYCVFTNRDIASWGKGFWKAYMSVSYLHIILSLHLGKLCSAQASLLLGWVTDSHCNILCNCQRLRSSPYCLLNIPLSP